MLWTYKPYIQLPKEEAGDCKPLKTGAGAAVTRSLPLLMGGKKSLTIVILHKGMEIVHSTGKRKQS